MRESGVLGRRGGWSPGLALVAVIVLGPGVTSGCRSGGDGGTHAADRAERDPAESEQVGDGGAVNSGSEQVGDGGAAGSAGEADAEIPVLVDDWSLSDYCANEGSYLSPVAPGSTLNLTSDGLATGGAMDVNNFRENIDSGYLPRVSDITHEGVFYGYFFDRGQAQPCTELFCPSYSQMLSSDILSGEEEYYVSVGLSSGLSEAQLQRRQLGLVVVLDVSGSMGGSFDSYYYDEFGNRVETEPSSTATKMEIANQAVIDMLSELRSGGRFGMVLFNELGHVAKPLSAVQTTDLDAIAEHIAELEPCGGTNLEAGLQEGTRLLQAHAGFDPEQYESRIILLTDAMPNTGATAEEALLGMVQDNAVERFYTTFIGVGVDFNSTLIEAITEVRGANYYSVHSEEEFRKRLGEQFAFMVTPLVFDLELKLQASGFEIEAVYGSPEADQATGVLMRANTLFPAASEGAETRGGVILLKLRRSGETSAVEVTTSYQNRSGESFVATEAFEYEAELDVAPNTGIQKAILLSRYVNLMRAWIASEREAAGLQPGTSEWEQTSLPLTVSEAYQTQFQEFLSGFAAERELLGDAELRREEDVLERLISWTP